MNLRLLIDLDVIEQMQKLPMVLRRRLLAQMRRIQDFPGHHSHYSFHDETGRLMDVCVTEKWAIHYWSDFNDRHVKVLKLTPADR